VRRSVHKCNTCQNKRLKYFNFSWCPQTCFERPSWKWIGDRGGRKQDTRTAQFFPIACLPPTRKSKPTSCLVCLDAGCLASVFDAIFSDSNRRRRGIEASVRMACCFRCHCSAGRGKPICLVCTAPCTGSYAAHLATDLVAQDSRSSKFGRIRRLLTGWVVIKRSKDCHRHQGTNFRIPGLR
jgi:hypothetical protein